MKGRDPRAAAQFGANLRRWRLSRELTQERLAFRSGVGTGQISRMERGVREPLVGTAVRLADALGVTPDALLRDISDSLLSVNLSNEEGLNDG